jgi:hypothetical protein
MSEREPKSPLYWRDRCQAAEARLAEVEVEKNTIRRDAFDLVRDAELERNAAQRRLAEVEAENKRLVEQRNAIDRRFMEWRAEHTGADTG